jgi:hypothetical protein
VWEGILEQAEDDLRANAVCVQLKEGVAVVGGASLVDSLLSVAAKNHCKTAILLFATDTQGVS